MFCMPKSGFAKIAQFTVFIPLSAVLGGMPATAKLDEDPAPPAFVRDTHLIENKKFTRPFQPALHTTRDGRIGLEPSGFGGLKFSLFLPEKLNAPFTTSEPGVDNVYAGNHSVRRVSQNQFRGGGSREVQFVSICDAAGRDSSHQPGNPRVCNGDDDCYDFTVISAVRAQAPNPGITFWGTKTSITVENPKTPNARIANITTGVPVKGSTFSEFRHFFETTTPADGRIMIGRTATPSISWVDEKNTNRTTNAGSVYLVNDNPDAFESCDVRQFNKVYPITNAPYDATINNRYGFAMHPFRDPTGKVISDNQSIGSYPWIDREANNISTTTLSGRLFNPAFPGGSRFPARCPIGVIRNLRGCLSDAMSDINSAKLQGRMIMGLWTNGKMVPMDNVINNMDFGLGTDDRRHREVQLYSADSQHDGWVRVGGGRNGGGVGALPRGANNVNLFASLEHRFNMFDHMKPVSATDVPWIVSKGAVSDEFSFDDYNNPDGFIVSSMFKASDINSRGRFNFYDSDPLNAIGNDATALPERWSIPAFGQVHNGRVEFVANGGIRGRGLWLDGEKTHVEYTIPHNSRNIDASPWYIGMFYDRRSSDQARNLISFSDGTAIRVRADGGIQFVDRNNVIVDEFSVPAVVQNRARRDSGKGWAHLGLNVRSGNRTIDVYYNGFYLKRFSAREAMFRMAAGKLHLGAKPGASAQGFRGWIDEFKVFAQNVNFEVACNHANGTLIGVPSGSEWDRVAASYPAGHNAVGDSVRIAGEVTHQRYACFHNYSGDYKANLRNIPANHKSVRDAINFPEGPVKFNAPRPDSSRNTFCLSCHVPGGKGGMGVDALTLNAGLMAQDDPRRQPTQPDAKVYGFIPANWLGLGKPARAMNVSNDGVKIDQWLLAQAASTPPPALRPITRPVPPVTPPARPPAVGGRPGPDSLPPKINVVGETPTTGSAQGERFNGDDEGNVIYGRNGDDSLFGGGGDDVLNGGKGNDYLNGGTGNDTFIIGEGNNKVRTGSGRDIIIIRKLGSDTDVHDFEAGLDRINLSRLDANSLMPGNQAFVIVAGRQFTGKAGELLVIQTNRSTKIRGDTDGDGTRDFSIWVANSNVDDVRAAILP